MSSIQSPRYWCVVPAAGVGTRMNASVPKQYLLLNNKTIIEHSLERLMQLPDLAGIVVAVSEDDDYWHELDVSQHPLVHSVIGGLERANSVLNGLSFLQNKAADSDWVLVHDAARPCVTVESVQMLCDAVASSAVGGILAVPVSDTLKNVNTREIANTVDRKSLWQAQTPQLFRYQLLVDCLSKTLFSGETITDESSAVELCGYTPVVVEGRSDNIKVTRPDDVALAEFILLKQSTQEK